ncbi:MAG: glycosyltransferase family 39 protein [Vicinamibacteria bacterium]
MVFLAVALGASLRFFGIGWGLQHTPHADEQAYVESVNAMLDAGDLDHRYYYYPGLFFYLLAPVVDLLGESRRHGPEAYLACRVLVAAIASLNVWIAGLVARSLAGPWAAGTAALALAVFPLSTAVAHEVRPDLCLEMLGLLSLLLYSRDRWTGREFAQSGLLAGFATAIKFSGLLFLSGTLVSAVVRRGRLAWLVGATVLTGLVVIVATPYALVHTDAYFGGRSELDVYFQGFTFAGLWRNVLTYGGAVFAFGGPIGVGAVVVGFVSIGRARFMTLVMPWLVHFAMTLSIFSLASIAFPRHMLQVTGGLCVFFGIGIARLAGSSRVTAMSVVALALLSPLRTSLDATRIQMIPSAPDRALEWIDAHMKDGAVILETRRDAAAGARAGATLGVDRSRFEFLTPEDPSRSELKLLMPHADLVIVDADRSTAGSLFSGYSLAYDARGGRGLRVLSLLIPSDRARPIVVMPAKVIASPGADAGALTDGRLSTVWSTQAPMNGTEWIELRFDRPHRLCRVDLETPLPSTDHEPELALKLGDRDGSELREVHAANARPSRDDQIKFGRPRGAALVFDPQESTSIRIEQRGARKDAWAISEVRAYECGPLAGASVVHQ